MRRWHPNWSGVLLLLFGFPSLLTWAQQQQNPNDVSRSNPLDPFNRQRYSPISSNQQPQFNPATNNDARNPNYGGRDFYGTDTNSIDNRFDPSRGDRDRDVLFQSTTPRDFSANRYGTTPRQRIFNPQSNRNSFLDSSNSPLGKEITYFVVASRMVRPGQIYKVSVNLLQAQHHMAVRASISRDGVELSSELKAVRVGVPETLLMRIPPPNVFS